MYDRAINVGDTLIYAVWEQSVYSFIVKEKRNDWMFVQPCDVMTNFHSSLFHKYESDFNLLYKVKEVYK